jgi:hypothetical protein
MAGPRPCRYRLDHPVRRDGVRVVSLGGVNALTVGLGVNIAPVLIHFSDLGGWLSRARPA